MLALHGLGASGRYWGRALDPLSPDSALIVPDLLGFGRSEKPDGDYRLAEHVGALERSLDRCAITDRLVLVGHSLGALIALAAAAEWGSRVRGVVIVSVPVFRTESRAWDHLAGMGAMAWLWINKPAIAHVICVGVRRAGPVSRFLAPILAPRYPGPVARDNLLHTWSSYRGSLRSLVEDAHITDWLTEIACPVRALHGELDETVPLEGVRAVLDPTRARLDVVPGAGHDLPLTHPSAVLATTAGLLPGATESG